jgi:virginiamycin B lyase
MRLSKIGLFLVIALAAGCNGGGILREMPTPAQNPGLVPLQTTIPNVVQHGSSWARFTLKNTSATLFNGITTGPDKNVWVAGGGNQIIQVKMNGAQQLFPMSNLFPYPDYLTVGADGRFYATDCYGQVAGITTSGVQTLYFAKDYVCGNVVEGPDTNVWFGEYNLFGGSGYVGNVSTAGTVTEYAIPNAGAVWLGVAVGPDGNIWLTDSGTDLLAKTVPSTGAVTTYSAGGTYNGSPVTCNPHSIIGAPDGNVYYDCGYYLAKASTGGRVTLIPNSNAFSSTGASGSQVFVVDPSGKSLWFVPAIPHGALGNYDLTTGHITIHAGPYTTDELVSVALGPDGNLWATSRYSKAHLDVYIRKILTVTPATLAFSAVGQQQTIAIAEQGTQRWHATSSNTAVATVAPGTDASHYIVTAAGVGSANVTVRDNIGNSVVVPVTVT